MTAPSAPPPTAAAVERLRALLDDYAQPLAVRDDLTLVLDQLDAQDKALSTLRVALTRARDRFEDEGAPRYWIDEATAALNPPEGDGSSTPTLAPFAPPYDGRQYPPSPSGIIHALDCPAGLDGNLCDCTPRAFGPAAAPSAPAAGGGDTPPGVVVPCPTCGTAWARMDEMGSLPWKTNAPRFAPSRHPYADGAGAELESAALVALQERNAPQEVKPGPVEPSPEGECASCGEECPPNECPKSKRPCGHHCNHSWTHDACDWCGKTFDCPDDAAGSDKPALAAPAPPASRTPPELAEPAFEIVDPSGRVSYRRPAGHPDLDEARRTPGYTIRSISRTPPEAP